MAILWRKWAVLVTVLDFEALKLNALIRPSCCRQDASFASNTKRKRKSRLVVRSSKENSVLGPSADTSSNSDINLRALQFLDNCQSGTQARRLLEKELLGERKSSSL